MPIYSCPADRLFGVFCEIFPAETWADRQSRFPACATSIFGSGLACQTPPEGQARWSLRLLADRMVELEYVEEVSYETVRRTLKKTR